MTDHLLLRRAVFSAAGRFGFAIRHLTASGSPFHVLAAWLHFLTALFLFSAAFFFLQAAVFLHAAFTFAIHCAT